MKERADFLEETTEKSTEAKEQTLQHAKKASNASVQPKPRESNPLIEKLIVIACLLLVAVCLELFVFPLVPQNQIVTPTTDKTQTNQNPSVSIQDTEAGGKSGDSYIITYKEYEYYNNDGFLVTVDDEEIDIRLRYDETEYYRYTEIELRDCDLPYFVVWF